MDESPAYIRVVNYFKSLFPIFLTCISLASYGETDTIYSATSIAGRWNYFDNKTKKERKVLPNEKVKSLKMTLFHKEFAQGKLLIVIADEPMLIINNKVAGFIKDSVWLDMDSLFRVYFSDRLDIALYKEGGIQTHFVESYLYKDGPPPEISTIQSRIFNPFTNNFLVVVLLITAFMAFTITKFPKDSADYSSVVRSLVGINREEPLISSRPLSRSNMVFSGLNALLLGFLFVSLNFLAPEAFNFPVFITYPFILRWLIVSFIIYGSIILKYAMISTFSSLFTLGDFRYIQFFNSIRYSIGVSAISFIILSVTYLTSQLNNLTIYPLIIYGFVFLIIVRTIILFFKLLNYSSYKIFHLFIYLCATELIPFIILFKIVLG